MPGKYSIVTKPLEKEAFKECHIEIIQLLQTNHLLKVEIMFGIFWGNHHNDWIPYVVTQDKILQKIEKADRSGFGSFYQDDLFAFLPKQTIEILCQEHDIHLTYRQENKFLLDIIKTWEGKNMILSKRENESP
jgi:desulfoferrodoxin (superoxide reductase-like protein)